MSGNRRHPGPPGDGDGEGSPSGKAQAALLREERLKAALKANMARRKAQSRARRETATDAVETQAAGLKTDGEDPADHNQSEE